VGCQVCWPKNGKKATNERISPSSLPEKGGFPGGESHKGFRGRVTGGAGWCGKGTGGGATIFIQCIHRRVPVKQGATQGRSLNGEKPPP